jgi:hypothetical protein
MRTPRQSTTSKPYRELVEKPSLNRRYCGNVLDGDLPVSAPEFRSNAFIRRRLNWIGLGEVTYTKVAGDRPGHLSSSHCGRRTEVRPDVGVPSAVARVRCRPPQGDPARISGAKGFSNRKRIALSKPVPGAFSDWVDNTPGQRLTLLGWHHKESKSTVCHQTSVWIRSGSGSVLAC